MIPKKIDIYGAPYTVEQKKGLSDSTGKLDGHCCSVERKIVLDPECTDPFGTFLHEALHGVLHRVGVNGNISEEVEEIIVSSIEKFIMERFDIKCKKSNANSKISGSSRKSKAKK